MRHYQSGYKDVEKVTLKTQHAYIKFCIFAGVTVFYNRAASLTDACALGWDTFHCLSQILADTGFFHAFKHAECNGAHLN